MKKIGFASCAAFVLNTIAAYGAETGMPQLDAEFWPSQIFWLIIIFSSLYLIIWKIFLPKISNNIENRKSKVVNDINETQKFKENAEKKLSEYNKIIEDAKKQSKLMIENSKKELENDIKNKNENFNQEIEKELLSVENEIKNLKKSSISNINKIASDTASEIVKEFMGTEVNRSSVAAIVNDIVKKKVEKLT